MMDIAARRPRARLWLGMAVACLVSAAGPSRAQTPIDAIAGYAGADRTDKLVAAARAEGTLTLYTVAPLEDVAAMTGAFTAKYRIPVTVWRGSSEDVLRRSVTEIRAGRYDADVIETNGPELEALHREKIFEPVATPVRRDVYPGAAPAHDEWIGSRLNLVTVAYNPDASGDGPPPRSWDDLLDPRWKGKIGLEAEAYDWFATVVSSFPSQAAGLDFFHTLASRDGISLRKGHSLLTNLTVSGEVPLSLTCYLYKVNQLERDGAPIKALAIGPAVARVNGLGVARTARHPAAALLFMDFTLTDGQKILADRGFTPTNVALFPLPKGQDIRVVDGATMLDELPKWRDAFEKAVK